MNPPTDLEDRLRTGLRSAAEELPPAPLRAAHALRVVDSPERHRHWVRPVLATAAAVAAVVGVTAMVIRDDGGSEPSEDGVTVATEPPTSATTSPPTTVAPRMDNGMTPGRAVITDSELRTFGGRGELIDTIDLAPLSLVQAAAADLTGGWVVCGLDAANQQDRLVWHPADGPSVVLDVRVMCSEQSLQVVDSEAGPMALYSNVLGLSHPITDEPPVFLHGVVLATGEVRSLPVVPATGPGTSLRWSATTGRVLVHVEGGGGFQLFDLDTGAELPMADVDLGSPSQVALAPDASAAAVLVGDVGGPVELIIFDVATGAELLRRSFPTSAEGDAMTYDGRTVAVGSFYADRGPVTVIDLTTDTEHTIDAHGVVL